MQVCREVCKNFKEDKCKQLLECNCTLSSGYYYSNGTTTSSQPPSVDYSPHILTIIDSIVVFFAIFGNTLVILSVWRFHHLRTATNMFILCLAIADLLVGLFTPYYVLFYFSGESMAWVCNKDPCLLRYFTILFGTITSMLFNIGAAVDRYIAVLHPYTYPRITDTIWIYVAISIAWIYVLIITSLPLFGLTLWKEKSECLCQYKRIECDLYFIVSFWYSMLAVGAHVLITLVLTTIMYVRIFRVAWRQMREIGNVEIDPRMRNETRTTRMMVLVLGVCLISLAPYLIAISLPYVRAGDIEDPQGLNKDNNYDKNIGLYKKFTVCFYLGKSAANPLIYGWKNKEFRMAFFKLLRLNNSSNRAAPTAEVRNSGIFVTVSN